MTTRTPSSLVWLINKRARLNGKIQQASELIGRICKLEADCLQWKADLAAIDRALVMHDIQVDIQSIPTVAPREERILAYGELTRVLIQFLRESGGEPLSTDTLAMMLINGGLMTKKVKLDPSSFEVVFKRCRESVHNRLKNLARNKEIIRVPCVNGSRAPRWVLPTDLLDS